jgi:hypothetical protein
MPENQFWPSFEQEPARAALLIKRSTPPFPSKKITGHGPERQAFRDLAAFVRS